MNELSSLSSVDDLTSEDTIAVSLPEANVSQTAKLRYPYRPSRTRYHDLLHTKLEVSLDFDSHTLKGVATLQLKPYARPQRTLQLDAKAFEIYEVSMLVDGQPNELDYEYDGSKINIDLGREYMKEENYLITISYLAQPDSVKLGGSDAITEDKGLYFIGTDQAIFGEKPKQAWTQGETQANSCWFPTIDAPNERSTQEMFIRVDTAFQTLSNGKLIYSQHNEDHTRTDYWKMDQPHAPYLFMMAVGNFSIVEDEWNGMEVNYLLDSAYEQYAYNIFGHTPEMIGYFSELLGLAYPWDKYSQVVVHDFVSGAMENTTASVFMEDLLVDDRELVDQHWDGIIAHELFHHWFGNLVTCESWANLPLNESFATYGEYLWHQHKYGQDEAAYVLWEQKENYLAEAEEKQEDLIRFYYANPEDMFDRHSYDKGSRVLHMLRGYLGDAIFFASLENYLTKHAFTSVEIHDLRQSFEGVSGEDLNWFFSQWFLSSGHPQLEVTHHYDSGQLHLQIKQVQDLNVSPLYYLPLTLEVWKDKEPTLYALEIDEQDNSWVLDVPKPDLVLLDPGHDMLVEVNHPKDVEEWIHQATNASHFISRIEALEQMSRDSLGNLAIAAIKGSLNDEFWAVRQLALNLLELNTDVLSDQDLRKINALALEDKKSLVRADAMTVLAAYNPNDHKDVFKEGIQDSSYAVVGSSVAAYTLSDATDKEELFGQVEKYSEFNVVIALADFYVEEQVPDKYDWFAKKFEQISDEALYYLLNYFARYLITLPEEDIGNGVSLLANYARFHPKYYIRLNAYRSLSFFDDQASVMLLRNEIKNSEKDKRLQELYKSIP